MFGPLLPSRELHVCVLIQVRSLKCQLERLIPSLTPSGLQRYEPWSCIGSFILGDGYHSRDSASNHGSSVPCERLQSCSLCNCVDSFRPKHTPNLGIRADPARSLANARDGVEQLKARPIAMTSRDSHWHRSSFLLSIRFDLRHDGTTVMGAEFDIGG